jgi:DNA-directed RNA polymerase subunit M/transcription elongation factor TFIIS
MVEIGFADRAWRQRSSSDAKINLTPKNLGESMAKIAKTADRKKVMDTTKSTDCPKCGKPTRIVKRVKDRERGVSGGIFISCSACEFYEKL